MNCTIFQRLSYSMDAMNADRPQWARDDTSQNINVSFDKNVSKPRVKPGHPSPEQKMPKQPPSARSERDPPSKCSLFYGSQKRSGVHAQC